MDLFDAANAIQSKLWGIEDALIQFRVETDPRAPESLIAWPVRLNDKLTTLLAFLQAADSRPTDQDRELFKDLSDRFAEQAAKLRDLIETDVPAFNRLARQQKAPEVMPKYTATMRPTTQ